jgi:hypothetical protein
MSILERVVARLFAVAARRWPASARENLIREWTAEAHELGHEAGVVAAVRAWRRLRFAASLACVRPQSGGTGQPGRVDAAERALGRGLMLFLAPLTAVGLVVLGTGPLWLYVMAGVTDSVAMTILYRAAQVAAGVVCGVVLARRLPRARLNEPVGVASRVGAVAVMAAGLVVADSVVRFVASAYTGVIPGVVGAFGLAALLLPLTAGVAGLARRSRLWAVAVAVVGAPVVVLSATWLVVRSSDPVPARAAGHPWWWLADVGRLVGPLYVKGGTGVDKPSPIETVLPLLPGVMLTTVTLALTYALRLSWPLPVVVRPVALPRSGLRTYLPLLGIVAIGLIGCTAGFVPFAAWRALPLPVVMCASATTLVVGLALVWRLRTARRRPTTPAAATEPAVGPRWWSTVALAGAVYSVLAWAVTLTYLTPNIGVQESWPRVGDPTPAGWPGWNSEEGRIWMQDLQLYAIGCAALCVLFAAAYRGAPVLPVLAGTVVLLVADVAVVHWHATRIELLPWLVGGVILLGAIVWAASVHLGRHSRRDADSRRAMVVRLTVMAAFLVPGIYIHRFVPRSGLPPAVLLVAVGLPTVLAVLAALGVTATSARETLRQQPPWRLPVTIGLGAGIVGTLSFIDFGLLDSESMGLWPLTYLSLVIAPMLAVPAAATAIEAIRPRRLSGPRRPAQWAGYIALMLLLGWVIAYITIIASFLGGPALPWLEYGAAYDGIPYVAGAFPVAALVALIAAGVVDRPVAALSPVDHELSPSA